MHPNTPQTPQATHAAMPTLAATTANVVLLPRPGRLLRLPPVQERTGLGKSSIYAAMAAGTFPTPVRLGTRGVAWREEEIDAWIQSRQTAEIRPVIKKSREGQ